MFNEEGDLMHKSFNVIRDYLRRGRGHLRLEMMEGRLKNGKKITYYVKIVSKVDAAFADQKMQGFIVSKQCKALYEFNSTDYVGLLLNALHIPETK